MSLIVAATFAWQPFCNSSGQLQSHVCRNVKRKRANDENVINSGRCICLATLMQLIRAVPYSAPPISYILRSYLAMALLFFLSGIRDHPYIMSSLLGGQLIPPPPIPLWYCHICTPSSLESP